jgi:hypothetical protein
MNILLFSFTFFGSLQQEELVLTHPYKYQLVNRDVRVNHETFQITEDRIFINNEIEFHVFNENGSFINTFETDDGSGHTWIANFAPIKHMRMVLLSILTRTTQGFKKGTIFVSWDGEFIGRAYNPTFDDPELQDSIHFRQVQVLESEIIIASTWDQNGSFVDFRKLYIEVESDARKNEDGRILLTTIGESLYRRQFDFSSPFARDKFYFISERNGEVILVHNREARAIKISLNRDTKATNESLNEFRLFLPNYNSLYDVASNAADQPRSSFDSKICGLSQTPRGGVIVAFKVDPLSEFQFVELNSDGEPVIDPLPKINTPDGATIISLDKQYLCYFREENGNYVITRTTILQ